MSNLAVVYLRRIEEGFPIEPPRHDSGTNFSEMIRARAASQSYRPKVGVTKARVTGRQTPRIRTESPRKGPE